MTAINCSLHFVSYVEIKATCMATVVHSTFLKGKKKRKKTSHLFSFILLPGITSFFWASITLAPPGTTRFLPTSLKGIKVIKVVSKCKFTINTNLPQSHYRHTWKHVYIYTHIRMLQTFAVTSLSKIKISHVQYYGMYSLTVLHYSTSLEYSLYQTTLNKNISFNHVIIIDNNSTLNKDTVFLCLEGKKYLKRYMTVVDATAA